MTHSIDVLYLPNPPSRSHMNCGICGQELNVPFKPDTSDCGGDCLKCMADCGDPECEEALRRLDNPETRPQEIIKYEASRKRRNS